jgi:alanyl-tRNA synthetase
MDSIASFVNDCIREAHIVQITEAPIDEAKARGAHAMFGEKYGSIVRVVEIPNISIELCGGNHVRTTKDLQVFKIISESGIAAGTRRIEALVGHERVERYNEEKRVLAFKEYRKRWLAVSEKLAQSKMPNSLDDTASMAEIYAAQEALINLSKTVEKALRESQKSTAGALFDDIIKSPIPLRSGHGVGVFRVLDDQPVPVLRELADRAVNALGDCVVVLGSSVNHKGHAIAKVSPSVMGNITAKELIDELTAITGGGGGGRGNMAQAGGLGAQKLKGAMTHMVEKYAQTSTGN